MYAYIPYALLVRTYSPENDITRRLSFDKNSKSNEKLFDGEGTAASRLAEAVILVLTHSPDVRRVAAT